MWINALTKGTSALNWFQTLNLPVMRPLLYTTEPLRLPIISMTSYVNLILIQISLHCPVIVFFSLDPVICKVAFLYFITLLSLYALPLVFITVFYISFQCFCQSNCSWIFLLLPLLPNLYISNPLCTPIPHPPPSSTKLLSEICTEQHTPAHTFVLYDIYRYIYICSTKVAIVFLFDIMPWLTPPPPPPQCEFIVVYGISSVNLWCPYPWGGGGGC